MSTTTVSAVRRGFHTITPYLQVMQVEEVINFCMEAGVWRARTFFRAPGGAGRRIHAGNARWRCDVDDWRRRSMEGAGASREEC